MRFESWDEAGEALLENVPGVGKASVESLEKKWRYRQYNVVFSVRIDDSDAEKIKESETITYLEESMSQLSNRHLVGGGIILLHLYGVIFGSVGLWFALQGSKTGVLTLFTGIAALWTGVFAEGMVEAHYGN